MLRSHLRTWSITWASMIWWLPALGQDDGVVLGRGITAVFSWGSPPLCLSLAHCVVYIHVVFCRRGWFLSVGGMMWSIDQYSTAIHSSACLRITDSPVGHTLIHGHGGRDVEIIRRLRDGNVSVFSDCRSGYECDLFCRWGFANESGRE